VRKQESMVNDPRNPADFDAPGLARHVLRTIRAGALATLEAETGAPFASLVSIATDMDGAPLFLLSELAAHTRHLERDPRASLLLCAGGKGDPLAHPRLTLTGQVIPDDTPRLRRRFLERHPKAALYADFADFSIHRFVLEAGHLNGGFARAARLAAGEILSDLTGAEALIDAEAGAVEHMNAEHRDALALYATVLCGGEPAAWRASGIDPNGMDLAAGDLTLRLDFPERVHDSGALRRMLVRLAGEARNTPERSQPAEPA
jgi:putative heme iron utilization protein